MPLYAALVFLVILSIYFFIEDLLLLISHLSHFLAVFLKCLINLDQTFTFIKYVQDIFNTFIIWSLNPSQIPAFLWWMSVVIIRIPIVVIQSQAGWFPSIQGMCSFYKLSIYFGVS